MKLIAFLIAIISTSTSHATPPSPQGHWTLKGYTCSSGAVPTPGFPSDMRIDMHLYDDAKFEEIMLQPERWVVARGTYTYTDTKICVDILEYIFPKNPPYTMPSRPTCMDYELKPTELIFKNPTGGSSCPQGDQYLIHFDLMKPL